MTVSIIGPHRLLIPNPVGLDATGYARPSCTWQSLAESRTPALVSHPQYHGGEYAVFMMLSSIM